MLSEPTSLLRLVNDEEGIIRAADGIAIYGAKAENTSSWSVPAYYKAPEFYLVGDIRLQQVDLMNMKVRYFSDNVTLTDQYQLNGYHQQALKYLTKALSISPQDKRDNTLLVIWLGSNEKMALLVGRRVVAVSWLTIYILIKRMIKTLTSIMQKPNLLLPMSNFINLLI